MSLNNKFHSSSETRAKFQLIKKLRRIQCQILKKQQLTFFQKIQKIIKLQWIYMKQTETLKRRNFNNYGEMKYSFFKNNLFIPKNSNF